MNFVVSIALGVIVGGIAIWQMSRKSDAEDEGEDSKAVSIEVVNGDNGRDNGKDVAEEIVEEIVIEIEDEPQANDATDAESDENAAEEAVEEIVIEQADEPQPSDAADAESDEDGAEEIAEEIIEEIVIEQADEPQSNDVADVEAAESVEAESTEAEETEIDTLQQIAGIGPTYARRIYDAGITSIETLSELTGESLQQIVTPGKSTPTAETEKWLEQARQLASA